MQVPKCIRVVLVASFCVAPFSMSLATGTGHSAPMTDRSWTVPSSLVALVPSTTSLIVEVPLPTLPPITLPPPTLPPPTLPEVTLPPVTVPTLPEVTLLLVTVPTLPEVTLPSTTLLPDPSPSPQTTVPEVTSPPATAQLPSKVGTTMPSAAAAGDASSTIPPPDTAVSDPQPDPSRPFEVGADSREDQATSTGQPHAAEPEGTRQRTERIHPALECIVRRLRRSGAVAPRIDLPDLSLT